MKIRAILSLAVLVSGLGVEKASACGGIAPFGDLGGAWCMIMAPLFQPATAYILGVPGSLVGITGAEFRMTGVPAGLYIVQATPNPAANLALGDPLGLGCNIAFVACQSGGTGSILLYTISLLNLSDTTGERTLLVERHTNPSNPNFLCPLFTLCDQPVFTKECVQGGRGFLNSHQNCEFAVNRAAWSEVKSLYAQ